MNATSGFESAIEARESYDAFAPFYDQFNSRYQFRKWTARLLAAAEEGGLQPTHDPTLLDVACGTGLSAIPMVERGWEVTGCDISSQMIAVARAKQIPHTQLCTADMRSLPQIGRFDLAWAVNDAMNYLVTVEELAAAISSLCRNLKWGGVLVFDVNTTATYAQFFDRRHVVPSDDGPLIWQGGLGPNDSRIHEARLSNGGGQTHLHLQRHFTEAEVIEAFRQARVRLVAVKGEFEGDLFGGLDEEVHTKAVYVGCRCRDPVR
jgi:ubiquinone/menaquinone biosynthesis C-methylase UbiE